jgi:hypothetical protein
MKTDTLLERMDLLMSECLPKIISTALRVGRRAHQPGNRLLSLMKSQEDKPITRIATEEKIFER